MSFNKSKCIIRKSYCGNGDLPQDTATKKYSRIGTINECLKKGFGIAQAEFNKKNISENSLQNIMYIGPTYEKNFKKNKINTLTGLIKKMTDFSVIEKRDFLYNSCKKSNNTIDYKAVNSVILYLHANKVKKLPSCKIISE